MTDWRVRPDDESETGSELRDSARQYLRNVATVATRTELRQLAEQAARVEASRSHIELAPADDWRNPVTRRAELSPPPDLVEFGRNVRRARRIIGLSQQRVADRAQISQSMLSRLERGLAPAMPTEALVRLGRVLGGAFPLGTCPHDHDCPWQPIIPAKHDESKVERFVAMLLAESPSQDFRDLTDALAGDG